jgi:hypothetical protein
MASPYEAGFDLREIAPLSRNNLPTPGVAPKECTGQRAGCLQGATETGYTSVPCPKDEASNLDIPCLRSGFRNERLGSFGNRCLRYFAECIGVNVGGSHMEMSNPSMKYASVGGVIVLGRRESRLHGEGRQGIDTLRVEISGHMPVKSGTTRVPWPGRVAEGGGRETKWDDKPSGNARGGRSIPGEPGAVKVARPVRRGEWGNRLVTM